MNQVAPVEKFAHHIRQRIAPGRRVAFVSGNFNVLHPGHLRLLKFAAENGDVLVVGVNADGTPGVTVPAARRLEGLRAIGMVNHAVLLNEPAHEFITKLRPEVVVKGKEYENLENFEQEAVDSYGGKLLFSSGEVRFTSANLLRRDHLEADFASIHKPLNYPLRHGFEIADIKDVISSIAGMRVLVIGDLIVDTYVDCEPIGMSQEDPTLVVTPFDETCFLGGAGIVAAHAAKLGAEVTLFTVGGRDEQLQFAMGQLDDVGVEHEILVDGTRPTTNKTRYRAQGKTLLRLNHMRQHEIDHDLVAQMTRRVESQLPHTDLILFSDFNYGVLPQNLVDETIHRAKAKGVMLAADSQASSQLSDISRFKGMALITPTEREARLAIRDRESGLVVLSETLRRAAQAENVVMTLGAEGLLVHASEDGSYQTDRLPALNGTPRDVAGAGDCLFACTALGMCAGTDVWRSVYFGSLAAAHQVSRVGNLPVDLEELAFLIDYPAE